MSFIVVSWFSLTLATQIFSQAIRSHSVKASHFFSVDVPGEIAQHTIHCMYLFTTVPHPHGHWQLQELLGNRHVLYQHVVFMGTMHPQIVVLASNKFTLVKVSVFGLADI